MNLLRSVKNKLGEGVRRRRDRVALSGLYAPEADDLDRERHVREAIAWLKRAQDAGSDAGVAYGVPFGAHFSPSYPETTGYICRTFLEQEEWTGDEDLLLRGIAMGDWEIEIQLPEGAVMAGTVTSNPAPAVFNTGMVLLGWSALLQRTGEDRFKDAARKAAEWMVSVQEPTGHWVRGNSPRADAKTTLYNVKAALGLHRAGEALGERRYMDAAVRNAEYCISHQHENGWLPDCCLSDPNAPLLHTLAYAMQGLVGIGREAGRDDILAGGRALADAQLNIMTPDGFLPGRQRADFSAPVDWCCLTGSAQTSRVWSELYALSGEARYKQAAATVNRYLMARHDVRNSDRRLRGGVPGSWPVWGEYGRLKILNWATTFFVDAVSLEMRNEE